VLEALIDRVAFTETFEKAIAVAIVMIQTSVPRLQQPLAAIG